MSHDLDGLLLEVLQKFESLSKRVLVSWVDLDSVSRDDFDENKDWACCLLGHTEVAFVGLHPCLVKAPKYVLRYLIFHEVLHLALPPHGRNCHHKAFRVAERLHPDYVRANRWLEKSSWKIRI